MNTPLTKAERKLMEKIGRLGGQARAKSLTRERRIEIATLASNAASKMRTARAGQKKNGT